MVCVPCIVIPVLLWVFHKFVQPFILKFWNPWGSKSVTEAGDTCFDALNKLDTTESKYINEKLTQNPVMVFSKTTCKFSNMAKEVLDGVGVNYEVTEIENMSNCQALQDTFNTITGARTVPRVFVGGKCIGGGSETWSLHNQGQLIPMCKKAGATFKKTD